MAEVGGIVGRTYSYGTRTSRPIVENCENYGNVLGSSRGMLMEYEKTALGGISGYSGYTDFTNCINCGRVEGGSRVGSILGSKGPDNTMTACSN